MSQTKYNIVNSASSQDFSNSKTLSNQAYLNETLYVLPNNTSQGLFPRNHLVSGKGGFSLFIIIFFLWSKNRQYGFFSLNKYFRKTFLEYIHFFYDLIWVLWKLIQEQGRSNFPHDNFSHNFTFLQFLANLLKKITEKI